jgi:hypothetical protein
MFSQNWALRAEQESYAQSENCRQWNATPLFCWASVPRPAGDLVSRPVFYEVASGGSDAMADPHWSAIVRDVVTSAAVLLGGAWAAWKWGYGETLRRRREMPSPDGTLTATSIRVDEITTVVTLSAIWRNRGLLPICLCAKHSFVKAFRLPNKLPIGNLILEKMAPTSVAEADWSDYVLEPNTDTVMTEHFVLKNDGIYGFKWTICIGQTHSRVTGATHHVDCTRELLWRSDLDVADRPLPEPIDYRSD